MRARMTYEEPGRGMTCGPSDETHAMQSWAGVMPLFCAIALSSSTIATLFFHACKRISYVLLPEKGSRIHTSPLARVS